MVIEITDLRIKSELVEKFKAKLPEFRNILLSLPGGIAARCLQDEADPSKFVFFTEWESMEAKDIFLADPRFVAWVGDFPDMIDEHVDRYFDEYH